MPREVSTVARKNSKRYCTSTDVPIDAAQSPWPGAHAGALDLHNKMTIAISQISTMSRMWYAFRMIK